MCADGRLALDCPATQARHFTVGLAITAAMTAALLTAGLVMELWRDGK